MLELFLILLFVIKHFIGDFVLQYPYMVEQKGTYGARGGIDHSAIHAGLTAVMLFAIGVDLGVTVVIALLDGLLHYHIDWAKMNLGKGLTPADKKFWFLIGADQLAHYLTYIVLVGAIVI